MSYVKLVSTGKGLGSTGGASDPIDTTGANLIVVFVDWVNSVRDPSALTDSKGNTWSNIPKNTAIVGRAFQIYYVFNPTVGSGHTFSSVQALGSIFNAIGVIAFSGATGSAHEVKAENTAGSGTSLQPGSVTPLTSNALVISGLFFNINSENATIGSGFTREVAVQGVASVNVPNFLAYKIISGAPAAQNPTWSWTTSGSNGGINVTFPGVGGGGGAGKGNSGGHGKGGGGVSVIYPSGAGIANIGNPGISIGST